MSKPADGEMTIRELAERTGMTVRNIRAHQTRGLLPPPVVRGRTGYYNDEHVSRIALTREMQADGLNLEAIRRVLESGEGAATEIFDFTRALRAPFEDEAPEIVEAAELASVWDNGDGAPDPELLRRAEKLGILRPLADGNFEELSPRLGRAAAELAALGVSSETALSVAREIRKHADAVAKTFVELFVREVWKPFEDQGRPEHDLPRVREAVERLRPLASDALLAVFQLAMSDAVDQRVGRELERLDRRR
jgi:DNA-binding transcriptional MerR regulator